MGNQHPQPRHPELVSGPIVPHVRSKRRQPQPHRQVRPMRVALVDQVDFPRPVPAFKLFFAQDCRFHPAEQLKVDETMNAVTRGMSRQRVIAMLPKPTDQMGSHANVKRSIKPTGQNVDARLLVLSSHAWNDAAKWALKQVQGDGLDLVLKLSSSLPLRRHPELVSGPIVPNALRVR